jgi:hypothetical protein
VGGNVAATAVVLGVLRHQLAGGSKEVHAFLTRASIHHWVTDIYQFQTTEKGNFGTLMAVQI